MKSTETLIPLRLLRVQYVVRKCQGYGTVPPSFDWCGAASRITARRRKDSQRLLLPRGLTETAVNITCNDLKKVAICSFFCSCYMQFDYMWAVSDQMRKKRDPLICNGTHPWFCVVPYVSHSSHRCRHRNWLKLDFRKRVRCSYIAVYGCWEPVHSALKYTLTLTDLQPSKLGRIHSGLIGSTNIIYVYNYHVWWFSISSTITSVSVVDAQIIVVMKAAAS